MILLLTLLQLTVATNAGKLGWDQSAVDLVSAEKFIYRIIKDSGPPTDLTGVTCTGIKSPFTCSVPFPSFTPGTHQIELITVDGTVESVRSEIFKFTFIMVPSAPQNIRRIP